VRLFRSHEGNSLTFFAPTNLDAPSANVVDKTRHITFGSQLLALKFYEEEGAYKPNVNININGKIL